MAAVIRLGDRRRWDRRGGYVRLRSTKPRVATAPAVIPANAGIQGLSCENV
ncbi:hypothetical protein [Lysobacter gummosus]|uniref:hypothetical protein n=1 Tax=Lysobacter gummosus TaxID=262324 RepID=UPI00363CC2DC